MRPFVSFASEYPYSPQLLWFIGQDVGMVEWEVAVRLWVDGWRVDRWDPMRIYQVGTGREFSVCGCNLEKRNRFRW